MTTIPFSDIIICITTGMFAAIVYEYMLWLSVKALPSIKHKGLWLLFTGFARLFVLLFSMAVVARNNLIHFVWIALAFLITRRIIIHFAKNIKEKECLKI